MNVGCRRYALLVAWRAARIGQITLVGFGFGTCVFFVNVAGCRMFCWLNFAKLHVIINGRFRTRRTEWIGM